MPIFEQEDNHPSYGILGFSRVTSSGETALFGSSVKHRDTIRLRLKQGYKQRGLNQDWYMGRGILFEVEMSYTQFAELITAMNVGDGVPVTIRKTMVSKNIEPCPFEDKSEQHISEFKNELAKTYEAERLLLQEVKELFSSKKTLTKADKEEVIQKLNKIEDGIGSSQDFQLKQFHRQMEQTVSEAKGEVEAFVQNKMYQIAQRKIVEEMPLALENYESPIKLEAGFQESDYT